MQPQEQININRAIQNAIMSPQAKTSPKVGVFPRPPQHVPASNQELESAE